MDVAIDTEWESPGKRGAEGATPPRKLSGTWTIRVRRRWR